MIEPMRKSYHKPNVHLFKERTLEAWELAEHNVDTILNLSDNMTRERHWASRFHLLDAWTEIGAKVACRCVRSYVLPDLI